MTDRTVAVGLKAEVSGFLAGIKAAEAQTRSFMGELDKSAKKKQALSDLGNTAGKMGLVAAAGLGAIVAVTANFDQAMSKVQAATHESASAMGDLRAAAIKAGADTAFSASEAAAGVENLAKAGVATADILGGGLSGALDLAAAGEMGVADAAETAATAMTIFNLTGKDVPHIADLLAAGAGKAQGEVSDMAMALKQSGLVAAQTGLTIEETTGTLAAFASAGLIGSDAGTSFKTMLQALTPTGAKAASAMDSLGITAYDAAGNFVGMTEFAASLQTGLKDLSVEQQNAAMKTIFGSDAVRAAAVVFQQGAKGVDEWIGKVDDSGYAAETAAIKLDNLKGDLEAFKGSLETALIGSGEGSQGMLRSITQGATNVLNAFSGLPPAAHNVVTGLLAITAVTGGGLWFGTKVIGGISNASRAMADLGLTSGKTGGALGKLGKSAKVAGGLLAGLAVVDIAQGGLKDYTIGVESMTSSLLKLSEAGIGDKIPEHLDGIADSIERLADPNKAQAFQDTIAGVIGFGGGSELAKSQAQIEALDAALSSLVADGRSDVANTVLGNLGLSNDQLKQLLALMPGYKEALAGSANAAALAAGATDGATGAIDALGGSADGTTTAVELLSDALSGLLDPLLDQDAATVAWKRSIQALTKELKGGSNALNENTKQGQDNRDAIRSRIDDLRGMVAADEAAGVGQHKLTKEMLAGVEQIVAMGAAANISKADMHAYLRELGLTPKAIKTVLTLDDEPASTKLQGFKGLLDGLNNRTVRTFIETITTQQSNKIDNAGKSGPAQANGGILDTYASGGVREPKIAKGGANILWAEPETGWEAYISGKPGMRDRNIGVLNEAARRLGVTRGNHAASGVAAAAGSASRAGPLEVRGTLSIDERGQVFLRGIAQDAVADAQSFAGTTRRMR